MASSRKKPKSVADMFPDDLVFEVLIRLPGKEIARCKCVCKSWRSVIRSAQFKDVYGTRHRGLILHWFQPVFNPAAGLTMSHSPLRLNVFYSPFHELKDPEQEEYGWLSELGTYGKNLKMTQIVNGLLCVDHGTAGTGTRLTIYNVCTREKMVIPSPLPSDDKDVETTFQLGYDPASKMYKLLRLTRCCDKNTVQAHIMTLRPSTSSSTWRELNHNNAASGASVIWEVRTYTSDGFLCWIVIGSASIVLFDLNKEKFHKILLPSGYLLRTLIFEDMFVRAQFMEHQRLAVTLWSSFSRCFECFVMDDDEGKRWSHDAIENPQEYAAVSLDPNGKSLSVIGEMVLINTVVNGADVYSIMARFEVDKQIDGPFHPVHKWDFERESYTTKPSCLLDASNLYLPLDDILGGQI